MSLLGTVASTVFAALMLAAVTLNLGLAGNVWSQCLERVLNGKHEYLNLHNRSFRFSNGLWWLFALVGAFVLSKSLPLGVSSLGVYTDTGYFVALVGTSFVAFGALCMSLHTFERLVFVLAIFLRRVTAKSAGPEIPGLFLAPWKDYEIEDAEYFAVTPILARPNWRSPFVSVKKGQQNTKQIVEWLLAEPAGLSTAEAQRRYAMRELIAREIWSLRCLALLALLSCLAGVVLVYYYPVPGRDGFLTLNMVLMVITALLFAVMTIRLERNEIASRLICDRDKNVRFSFGMLNIIALPFVLIALAITVSEVPGVREATGSWISPLLNLLGLKWF